ncbi:MAG: hypothetical protein KGH78_02820, partial [Candidatus Micrarchaeota archaeon]|nr:hypothetical protein [Candidatus Micrarchaeota archaeon]
MACSCGHDSAEEMQAGACGCGKAEGSCGCGRSGSDSCGCGNHEGAHGVSAHEGGTGGGGRHHDHHEHKEMKASGPINPPAGPTAQQVSVATASGTVTTQVQAAALEEPIHLAVYHRDIKEIEKMPV